MRRFFLGALWLATLALAQPGTCQTKLEPGVSCQGFTVQLADFESRAELMYPSNASQPLPTVLLVHAGYPSDLDGTFSEGDKLISRNLLTIAEYLSKQGFAVARYNKRYVKNADDVDSRLYERLGIPDFVSDAKTMLKTLLENPRVNPKRLFIMGWSEGALVSTRAALEFPSLRGVILMSPPVIIEGKDYGLLTPAKQIKQPVLILQGSSDQITEVKFTPQLEQAFSQNPDFTIRYYPGLRHGLGQDSEFSTIDPAPLHDLELWLKQHSQ